MDVSDDEILTLWRLLNQHQVKYILVGGFATMFNGFNRVTSDLDLWIKDTLENRKALRAALKDFGLGDFEAIETVQFIAGFSSMRLDSGFELDLMTSLKGLDQSEFDACYEISPTAVIDGVSIKFLHLNRLIDAKRASSRPKDLVDLEELEKIRKNLT